MEYAQWPCFYDLCTQRYRRLHQTITETRLFQLLKNWSYGVYWDICKPVVAAWLHPSWHFHTFFILDAQRLFTIVCATKLKNVTYEDCPKNYFFRQVYFLMRSIHINQHQKIWRHALRCLKHNSSFVGNTFDMPDLYPCRLCKPQKLVMKMKKIIFRGYRGFLCLH